MVPLKHLLIENGGFPLPLSFLIGLIRRPLVRLSSFLRGKTRAATLIPLGKAPSAPPALITRRYGWYSMEFE